MTDKKYELLKDTNPDAFEELEEFYAIYGEEGYKKNELPSNAEHYVGQWKCPTGEHNWISTINYRAYKDSDPGCIICRSKNLKPKILQQRFHIRQDMVRIESLMYCPDCYLISWMRHTDSIDSFSKKHYCDEQLIPFSEEYPDIASEWSENNFLEPNKVSFIADSSLELEWKCKECGMYYNATIQQKRGKRNICPYCLGKYPYPGKSLADIYPAIAKRMHKKYFYENPKNIFPDSKRFAGFQCPDCGVIYKNRIAEEVTKQECPYCKSGMTKDLSARIYREIIAKNSEKDIPFYSEQKKPFEWRCETCGQKYIAAPIDRFRNREKCPFCSGKFVLPGKTSFKALYPNLEKELIYDELIDFDTDAILATYYGKKVNWKCQECNMTWQSHISERVRGVAKCPYCAGKKAIPGKTSFKALYPDIATEYSIENKKDPDKFLPTSNFEVLWKCGVCDMQWKATIKNRVKNIETCPYCDGRKVIPGKTSFKALYPDIAAEYSIENEKNPDNLFPTSSFQALWKCNICGMQWNATIKNRAENTETCPYCNGKKVIPNKTSLYALFQELISHEWKYQSNILIVDPCMEFPDSNKQAWWKCNICGRTYSSPIKQRVRDFKRNRNSCTYCKGHIRIKYRN